MGIAYNTSIVRDGLVLHLDAANVKSYPGSGTTWKDLSGNGNDALLVNSPTYRDNGILSGFSQDGTDSYIYVPNFTNISREWPDKFTIMSFYYKENENENYYMSSSTVDGRFYFGFEPSRGGDYATNFVLRSFGGLHLFSTSKPFNGYTCLGLISDGTLPNQVDMKTFHNGDITFNLQITSDRGFKLDKIGKGEANDIVFCHLEYDRALTELEIKQNFEAMRGRYGI